LSQQFAARGLQFFKVNKTVTHVAVARPHFLDLEATPVSEGVKRIVDFINTTPKCTHKQLLKALAPSPAVPVPVTPAPETVPAAEGAAPAASQPAASAEPTPEMAAVMTDLHWLIHQGHVIEFANGILETAKKPLPKPPKPAKPESQPGSAEGTVAPVAATTDAAAVSVETPAVEAESLPGEHTPTVESTAGEVTANAPGDAPAAATAQPAS
jgi:hypothetical protein